MKLKDIKLGMRVHVARKVTSEDGWKNVWVDEMDEYIGSYQSVTSVTETGVRMHGLYASFPAGALDAVPESPLEYPTGHIYSGGRFVPSSDAAPQSPPATPAPYEYKIGDRGLTRSSKDYVIRAVIEGRTPDSYTIAAEVNGSLMAFTSDGSYDPGYGVENDLLPPKRVVWVNFDFAGFAYYHDSELEARNVEYFKGRRILARAVRVELPVA